MGKWLIYKYQYYYFHTFETSTTHDVAHHQRGFDVALQADSLASPINFLSFDFLRLLE